MCVPDSNNLMWFTHVCQQTPLLKGDGSHEEYLKWLLALALNRLGMFDKRTCVHYPRMHVSCSLLSLVAITTIIVHAALANLPCKCL